ncbi:Bug family tripartite tricarboxylate transporter substrate binding protein [Rhodoferax sediminis]|uniref:Bug family tripartite tricarboxylate transporter substrate binding protein n=1 Tax=Rhodoferax sediminis TaxID=2509614 RepID=UPI00143DB289|nr:tripartite tricarboxylate transporter substrate binding protein [Rhodoferax sediminis]
MNLFHSLRHLTVLGLSLITGATAWAQPADYPTRPITIIVPYSAGGIGDSLARIIGDKVSQILRQPVIVEDRPGGNANIGILAVAKAAPDGYTWLLAAPALTANPSLYKHAWDPLKDFIGVGIAVSAPSLLVVPAQSKVRDLKDFIGLAKQSPSKLNYGNPGIGSSMHLNTELFKMASGIDLVSIPYKAQPGVLTALIRGDVAIAFLSTGLAAPQITSGRLKPLAVVAEHRIPGFPDVPTLAEAGYGEANVVPWYGFAVPGATPHATALRINDAINRALSSSDVQDKLRNLDMVPQSPRSLDEISAVIRSDYEKYRAVIKKAGITAD